MDPAIPIALAIVGMALCLLLVPLGLPGVWLMIGILTVGTAFDEVAPWLLLLLVGVAGAAELGEYLLVKRTSERFGASRKAFWGAIAGGIVGVVVGVPVPLVGPLLAGLAGTFLGAAAVALWETRELRAAGRIGWGALLGRILAAALKTGAGLFVLVVGSTALLIR